MVKKRKVELYEILSGRQPEEGQQLAGSLYPAPIGTQLADFSRKRTGREVVFSLNGAFVIFVAFLIIIGTSYKLGHDKGVQEKDARFPVQDVEKKDDGGILGLSARVKNPDSATVSIEPGRYTLKVASLKRNRENLRSIKELRKVLQAVAPIYNRIETIVFDNAGNDRYTLGIGVFEHSDDRVLLMIRDYIKQTPPQQLKGNLLGVSIERAEDLGKPIL